MLTQTQKDGGGEGYLLQPGGSAQGNPYMQAPPSGVAVTREGGDHMTGTRQVSIKHPGGRPWISTYLGGVLGESLNLGEPQCPPLGKEGPGIPGHLGTGALELEFISVVENTMYAKHSMQISYFILIGIVIST